MRFIIAATLLALSGCTAGTITAAPASVADTTMLDENAATGAEVAYTTASKLGTALAQGGIIDKARFKAADAKAYTALLAVRAAYRAGNATSYVSSIAEVYAAVADIRALVKG